MDERWECTWETGPDAGGATTLGGAAGPDRRWTIGRAAGADVRCDDPALEPHHALLGIGADGLPWLVQLAGRAPVVVDGRAQPAGAGGDGLVLADGALVEIGAATLRVRRCAAGPSSPVHLLDGAVVRGPRAVPHWDPEVLTPPTEPEPRGDLPGGMLPAMIGLAGAGVIALVMHQPMFLVFGALGALVAAGSWLAQRIGLARRTRRDRRAHQQGMADHCARETELRRAYVEHVHLHTSTVASARRTVEQLDDRLWARRAVDDDAFVVGIGTGEHAWHTPIDRATEPTPATPPELHVPLRDLPIAVDLGPAARVALRGPTERTRAVARAMVVQLAATSGPADVRIVVVTHEPAAWQWAAALPHLTTGQGDSALLVPAQTAELAAAFDPPGGPHLVVVTDAPELLAARTSALRRAVTGERAPALIALVGNDVGVPHVCRSVLTLTAGPIARWVTDTGASALPQPVRVAGIGSAAAAALAARLAPLSDPDDPLAAGSCLPTEVSLLELLAIDDGAPVTPASVAARWLAGGNDPAPRAPIGQAADGLVDIDLVRDGPHGLIAGTTGAGKSELLRSLVVAMAAGASPDHLTFVLVDYKGGATFDACAALPHVVGVVTDLDEHLADRALRSLQAELRRREHLLREHGAGDLAALREVAPKVVLPRLVVVIDEFAALVTEQPAFLHALVGVAQRGRSLGVHLLLATQRPNGVISDDIRANTNIRLALRLHDAADAIDVVGDPSPTTIQRRTPGRAVLRLGPDEHVTFQSARCTASVSGTTGRTELERVVRAIDGAARIVGLQPPQPPWQPPLPATLQRDEIDARDERGLDHVDVVGLLDDPDHQRVRPFTWTPERGHLLVAGSPGSGVTTTLVALGALALRRSRTTHLYIVDAVGDDALSRFERHAGSAGVVRLHERERLMRLLHRLAGEVEQRAAVAGRARDGGPPPADVVLLIDGFLALRRALDDLDTAGELDALDRIIAGGQAAGITVVLTVDQPGAVPAAVLAQCRERWVLHLTDRLDGAGLGVAAAAVPAAIPGRIAIAGGEAGGLHAHLARPPLNVGLGLALAAAPNPGHAPAIGADDERPAPIECMPEAIDAADLGVGRHVDVATCIPVGRAFATGSIAAMEIPEGEHVMIVGPARSGRSTALARIVTAWREAHPLGWCGVITPRSSPSRVVDGLAATHQSLADLLAAVPTPTDSAGVLIAVDDADVVDDPGGALAGLAGSRRPDVLIVAVGRPDSLRQTYGHWTTVLRRSRLGLVSAAASDLDGDLLGASLPRRLPIPARPGLAWLVDNGSCLLVQVGRDTPGDGAGQRASSSAISRLPATIR